MSTPNTKEVVREKYGQAASRVKSGASYSCCSDRSTLEASCDPITFNLYDSAQKDELPDTAVKASLGCGNPTALAELKPGETVLDLGSGGGIDVLLSARRVGPTGKAYGLDMTDRSLGWIDCACRTRCGNGRDRCCSTGIRRGEVCHPRPNAIPGGFIRSRQGGGGAANPAEDHDRQRDSLWSASDHVVTGHAGGRGCDEANRYANDWRRDYFCNSRVANLSSDLCALEEALIA
jgi:hypothetical protein